MAEERHKIHNQVCVSVRAVSEVKPCRQHSTFISVNQVRSFRTFLCGHGDATSHTHTHTRTHNPLELTAGYFSPCREQGGELINSRDVRVAECTRGGKKNKKQETTAERRASPMGAEGRDCGRSPPTTSGKAAPRRPFVGRERQAANAVIRCHSQRTMDKGQWRRRRHSPRAPTFLLALLFRPRSFASVSFASVALSIAGVQLSDAQGRAYTGNESDENECIVEAEQK